MSGLALFEQALGAGFATLAPALRRFHRLQGNHALHGTVETDAPASLVARLLALCLGTPRRAERGPIVFRLEASPRSERWTRRFPSKTTSSVLSLDGGSLIESMGPVRMAFAVDAIEGALVMRLQHLTVAGLPCPAWLRPRVRAEEHGDGDHLRFHIEAALPMVGVVAGYRGRLLVPDPSKAGSA